MLARAAPKFLSSNLASFLVGLVAFSVGLAYLAVKVQSVSATAGYDLRYIWVAAQMWFSGAAPYSASYRDVAATLVTEGHVPVMWPYPPNWWPVSLVPGFDDILRANIIFNLAGVAALFIAALIVGEECANQAVRRLGSATGNGYRVFAIQGVIFLLLAATEATAIHISTGQTTAFPTLGGALLLRGLSRNSAPLRVVGFVLLFLKPQIGIPFAAAALIADRRAASALVTAGGVSLLMALPALVAHPAAITGFMRNAVAYRDVALANAPGATTGLRSLVHALVGVDIGNFAALGAATIAAMALVRRLATAGYDRSMMVPIVAVAVLALAPLHYYDFILVLLALPLVPGLPQLRIWAFAAGYLLIFRADNLGAAIGFYDAAVGIFEGSWLSTIGAIVMLLATFPKTGLRVGR